MLRPQSSLEKFIKRFSDEHALLAGLFYILLFGTWLYLSLRLGTWFGGDWAMFWACLGVAVTGIILYYTILSAWHRLEHPSWYERKHLREGGISFNEKANRFEIGKARLYSYHELSNRRGKTQLWDPDRSY